MYYCKIHYIIRIVYLNIQILLTLNNLTLYNLMGILMLDYFPNYLMTNKIKKYVIVSSFLYLHTNKIETVRHKRY